MPDLTKQLKHRKPGEWVVLDRASMKCVLGVGATPAKALAHARRRKKLGATEQGVLLQVPDPNTVHVY